MVRAAGGVSSSELACKLIEAGADRIGASRPLEILADAPQRRRVDSAPNR